MKKLTLLLLAFVLFAQIIFSQTVEKAKKDEISPELKKEAIVFLRETAVDIGTMRTLENRISFSSEVANLMWSNDEKEARAMFRAIINDFSQLLAQYNAQALTAETAAYINTDSPPYSVVGKNDMVRKFVKALSVRQQIATSLAENNAQLAFDFLNDTAQSVTAATFRKQIEGSDAYFQTRLLNQIAAQNPDAALKYGRKTLEKGFNYEHINLLKKIYAKDADKGVSFGEDVLAKIKSDGAKNGYYEGVGALMDFGVKSLEQNKGKENTPIFSEQSMREIADLLAQGLLRVEVSEGSEVREYLPQIEKYAPARAEQIRQKYAAKLQSGNGGGSANGTLGGRAIVSPPPPPPPPMAKSGSEQERQKQLTENMQKLAAKQLSKEERQKVVAQTRKIIADVKEPNQKLFLLNALAAQVAVAGDKELALQVLGEARESISSQPKNYQEFIQTWLLAGGYAQVDAGKAFPILEDTIFRINDTIGAAVKIAEFVDTNNEILEDGEVQIGSFGGGGMMRGLLASLGAVDATMRGLAKADFARTKALTNKFDRPEARILAKMLILRGIFGDKKEITEK